MSDMARTTLVLQAKVVVFYVGGYPWNITPYIMRPLLRFLLVNWQHGTINMQSHHGVSNLTWAAINLVVLLVISLSLEFFPTAQTMIYRFGHTWSQLMVNSSFRAFLPTKKAQKKIVTLSTTTQNTRLRDSGWKQLMKHSIIKNHGSTAYFHRTVSFGLTLQ